MGEFVIGRRDGDRVQVQVRARRFPDALDHADGNWLDSPVSVRAGGFGAEIDAELRADELVLFRRGLQDVLADGHGHASLETAEAKLDLDVDCEPGGAVAVTGCARDGRVRATELEFSISGLTLDDLAALVRSLLVLESAFPVRGVPDGERMFLRRSRGSRV